MPKEDSGSTESKRILERVSMESDSRDALAGRAAQRPRDPAADADRDDWAEYWGRRIGRTLAVIITIGIVGWLVLYVLGAG